MAKRKTSNKKKGQRRAAAHASAASSRRAAPQASLAKASFSLPDYLPWFLVTLGVFACLHNMIASNYLPKTFWAATTVALGLILLRHKVAPRLALTPLGVVWIAYIGWALLSLTWAQSPRVSFERLIALLLPTAAYFLALRARFWESSRFWMLFSCVFILFCLIGCAQSVIDVDASSRSGMMGSFHRLFSFVHWFPGTQPPRATVGHRNYAALYLTLVLPLILVRAFRSQGKEAPLLAVATFLGVLFLVFTRARQGWVGFGFSLLFLLPVGALGLRRLRGARLWACAGLAILAIAASFIITPKGHVKVSDEIGMVDSLGGAKKSILDTIISTFDDAEGESRVAMWRAALNVPINRIRGCGFGNFPIAATPYNPTKNPYTLNYEAHSDYLQAFVDLGAVGLALFVLILLILLRQAWRGRKDPMVAAAGASIIGLFMIQFFTFTSEKVATLVWIAGAAAILNAQNAAAPRWSMPMPRWSTRLLNLAAAGALVCFATTVAFSIWGDRQFHNKEVKSLQRLTTQVLPKMRFDVNMVHTTVHTFAKDLWQIRTKPESTQHQGAASLAAIEVFAKKALSLHPTDLICLDILANIAHKKGQTKELKTHLRTIYDAFGPNPYYPPIPDYTRSLLALYQKDGNNEEVRRIEQEMAKYKINTPTHLEPADSATTVSLTPTFTWQGSPDPRVSYHFKLWKMGEPTPERPRARLTKPEIRLPEPLEPNTVYFWQVESVGRYKSQKNKTKAFRTKRE